MKNRTRDLRRVVATLRFIKQKGRVPEVNDDIDAAIENLNEAIYRCSLPRYPQQTKELVERLLRMGYSYRYIILTCHVGKDFIYRTKKRLNLIPEK